MKSDSTSAVWPTAALIFVAAWVLNNVFGLWVLDHAPIVNDAREYFDRGTELWKGVDDGKAHYWPPGGPFVLAALFKLLGGPDESMTQGFMAGVSAATTALVFLLGREVFSSRRVGIVAAVLYGLSPTTIWMSRQTEGHTFCALWIALAALFAVKYFRSGRGEQLLVVALSLALLVLTRPGSALLVSVLLLLPWLRKVWGSGAPTGATETTALQALLHTVLAGIAVAALLVPVLQFNHERGAGWVFSTNNERNFFLGNNPYTPSYKTGHLAWRPIEALPDAVQAYLTQHYDAPQPRQAMMDSAWGWIRQEPLKFVQRSFNRFVNYWTFDYEQGRRLQLHLAAKGKVSWLPMAVQALYSAVLIWLFFTTLPALLRSPQRGAVLAMLAVVLMYQLPHIIAFSSPVYRAGLMPLICLMTGAGVSGWGRGHEAAGSLGAERRRSMIRTGAVAAVLLLAAHAQAAYYLVKMA